MSRVLFILPILLFVLNSCFIADDLFIPPPPEDPKSLQEQSESTVEEYLISETKGYKYKPFGFSQITIQKPLELLELEKLKKKYAESPDTATNTKIKELKKIIQDNNIKRSIEIDHFYTLKDSSGNLIAFEDKYILNDTLGIQSSKPLIMLDIPDDYKDVLTYYFFEYTIFLAETYADSKNLSKEFYQFFKSRLEELEGITAKSNFLWHTLQICKKVKKTGEFDQQGVLEGFVKKYIQEERQDIQQYRPLKFSPLFEQPSENKDLKNYYFFHKFIGLYKDELDTNVIMIEFSPYYEIDEIYQMERPFDIYFK